MTKEQKNAAEAFQSKLAINGLNVKVSFTRKGYCRLTVPAETMKNFTCLATVAARAAEILGCSINNFYMAYGD